MNCFTLSSTGLYDIDANTITSDNITVYSKLNVSGFTTLNNNTTVNSSLNVSGLTTLNNATSINSSLNVSGNSYFNNLNVSGNSYFNNLNVSGSSYFYGHIFAQQNIYGKSILPQFDPLVPNIALTLTTRGNCSLNLRSSGGQIILNTSGLNIITIDNTTTTINSALTVSGISLLNNNVSISSSLSVSNLSLLNSVSINGLLYVSGLTTINNSTSINSSLNVSGNSTFKSSIYCNGNDNKVLIFDGASYGRLGFLKQAGTIPKICAGTGTSIIFSHLGSGDLTQVISSSGITVLDRMTINGIGNVGIGVQNPLQQLHVSGATL